MKIHETISHHKEHPQVRSRYELIPERWTEWLRVEVGEGACRPRWYLPVYRHQMKYAYVCYVFPIAPFVMIWKIVSTVLWAIWNDLREQLELLRTK